MIGQRVASEHAERDGALVLAATAPAQPIENTLGHAVSRTAEVEALMTHLPTDPKEALKALLLTIYSPAFLEAHAELIQAELQAIPVPEYAQRLHLQAVKGHDAWDLLPTIQAPTLVIHGSDDQRLPTANAYLLAGRIPGAELSIIQGGRHGFLVEKRSEASRVVNAFLARHPLS